ncbi:hypothetical protein PDJAM_G00259010 [Pangasius djambal]|nr:hypothetical protein [Pangasius djambal]
MFYLGKYIMSKELYDKQQQHIVHCGNNALGAVFGVANFSVKEPRALYAMIFKHLIAVKIPESQSTFSEGSTLSEADRGPEVMFYLGKYIMSKELYDKQQQHIVHCGNNALGAVFGVANFSVKEPRALYAMIFKHLIAVKIPESQSTFSEGSTLSEADRGPEETNPRSSTSTQQQQQRRRLRSSDPREDLTLPVAARSAEGGFGLGVWGEGHQPVALGQVEGGDKALFKRSARLSTHGMGSLSNWETRCVKPGGVEKMSENWSTSSVLSLRRDQVFPFWTKDIDRSPSDEGDESDDSDSDKFSVEFEVESCNSDAYSENDEDSVPGEDEVYDVTISAEDEASFDEDTEITEEDIDRSPSDEGDESDDSDSDKFSVEFEVESCNSDAYSENDEDSVPGEDEVYDVTISAEDEASFDEDTEITEEPSTSSSQEKTPELECTSSLNSTRSCLPAYCLEPCVICQSRPKNGCIVHRRTGHLMACYICAKKLKKHNKLCPVCREPIQSVVLTYVS